MRKVKKGLSFTLIELMIVIAIIAIIAAIAIPNLLSARMSANETAAVGTLDAIKKAEKMFMDRDLDGDGVQDYYVTDVYGLYGSTKPGTTSEKIKLIDVATAKSDNNSTNVTSPVAKQGYFCAAITRDVNGTNYSSVAESSFGFCAFPKKFGKTGEKVYIVNEEGVIYYCAAGDNYDQETLGTSATAVSQWPAEDPTTATLGGSSWYQVK